MCLIRKTNFRWLPWTTCVSKCLQATEDAEIYLTFPVYLHLWQEVAADHVPIEAMRNKILLELIQPVKWQKFLNRTTQDSSESSCQGRVIPAEQIVPVLVSEFRRRVHIHEERWVDCWRSVLHRLEVEEYGVTRFPES